MDYKYHFVHMWRGICLSSTMMVIFNGIFAGAAPSVDVAFNDTRCGRSVCPADPLLVTCTANNVPSTTITITLRPGELITLIQTNGVPIVTPLPDGFAVEVMDVTGVVGSVNFILSLSIRNASLLSGAIECATGSSPSIMDMADCPVATVQAPSNITQMSSSNTPTTATVTWTEPSDTGGSDITQYTVSSTSLETPVNVNAPTLSYTLTGLVVDTNYTVCVTATGECGLESQPSEELTVRIPVAGPLPPDISDPVLECEVESNAMSSKFTVSWIYADNPSPSSSGLIYPNITNVSVFYTDSINVNMTNCDDFTGNFSSGDSDSCSSPLLFSNDDPMFNVTISVNVSNKWGSDVAERTFDMKPLQVVNKLTSDSPHIEVTLNPLCNRDAVYTLEVSFGALDGGECIPSKSVTMEISPNVPVSVDVPVSVEVDPGDLCHEIVSLDGMATSATSATTDPDDVVISTGVIIAIVVAAIVIIAVIVAIVVVVVVCIKKNTGDHKTNKLIPPSPIELTNKSPAAPSDPAPIQSTGDQDPGTITHTPHPETGELYTDVNIKKKKKTEEVDAGPMYQDPQTIEHQTTDSGDTYAMPQKKKGKKGKKGKKEREEEQLTEEEKAAMHSVPDRKAQKSKSEGLMYAELDMHSSSKPPQPSQHSFYAAVQHQD